MLDLRLVECFLAVAEAQSFSRAGERLGIAQSGISTRVQRLEDVLRIPLLMRTSRKVRLTSQGLAFLPYARALLAAEAEACAAARDIADNSGRSLMVGSYHFLVKARSKLISRYVALHPDSEILVLYGTREELVDQLRARTIDVVIGLSAPGDREDGIDIRPVSELVGHLVVPPGDMFYHLERVSLSMLAGRSIAVTPNRTDRKVLLQISSLLAQHRLRPILAPEADRDVIDAYARARGLLHLRWFGRRRVRHLHQGWAVVPFEDAEMMMQVAVLTAEGPQKTAAQDFVDAVTGR